MWPWVSVVLFAAASIGCASTPRKSKLTGRDEVVHREDGLRRQAGFMFNCPPAELVVVAISGERTAGVAGCGHRGVYKYIDLATGWVANQTTTNEAPE